MNSEFDNVPESQEPGFEELETKETEVESSEEGGELGDDSKLKEEETN